MHYIKTQIQSLFKYLRSAICISRNTRRHFRANFGRPGAASAWDSAIANIQHNRFCKGSQIIVLGQINVTEEMIAVENLNFNDIKDRSKLSQ
jgi:hypothetical protein